MYLPLAESVALHTDINISSLPIPLSSGHSDECNLLPWICSVLYSATQEALSTELLLLEITWTGTKMLLLQQHHLHFQHTHTVQCLDPP